MSNNIRKNDPWKCDICTKPFDVTETIFYGKCYSCYAYCESARGNRVEPDKSTIGFHCIACWKEFDVLETIAEDKCRKCYSQTFPSK